MNFSRSRALQQRLHDAIPGGCHTYAKGDDQFPLLAPGVIARGKGSHIWDVDGNEYIEYGMGCRAVTLGRLPVEKMLTWTELRTHVHTLPDHPDWIPYRTAYFRDQWGFCSTQTLYEELDREPEKLYHVCIDATLDEGSLTYGELLVSGQSDEDVLISCHICHPSLANDNVAGIAVAAKLAQHLRAQKQLRYNYRFVFVPATIGAITWLSVNELQLDRIKHGLVLSLLGDGGQPTYKQSRRGDAEIDRIAAQVLGETAGKFEIRPFEPFGYDERQYCSAGINLPMGCLMRTPNGEYPEYHTSADNLDLICAEAAPCYLTT